MSTYESELAYFTPILLSAEAATAENRALWRTETVEQRRRRVSKAVYDIYNGVVNYGPFKGLQLNDDTWWGQSDLGSQCLGLYEREILEFISGINNDEFNTFIDIGAADGYYAIGMLLSGKVNKTICFEMSEKGREVIHENWVKNGATGKLEVFGKVDAVSLANLSREDRANALILIDIEGNEFELLKAEALRLLSNCTLIIEIHNWVDDFLAKYKEFLESAGEYFQVEVLSWIARDTNHIDELNGFSDDNRLLLVSEGRPCRMRFIKLTPKR